MGNSSTKLQKDVLGAHIERATSSMAPFFRIMYDQVIAFDPKFIVELGIKNGDSARMFGIACNHCTNTEYIGIDISEQPNCVFCEDNIYQHFYFGLNSIKVATTYNIFKKQSIDILCIDTSHEYEHTKKEIEAWFPLLSDTCIVFLHDTNLQKDLFFSDRIKKGKGWDNKRGVIRAIQEYLDTYWDETKKFCGMSDNKEWLIWHSPYSAGMTIIVRDKI